MTINSAFSKKVSQWNFIYIFLVIGFTFIVLLSSLVNLQVVNSHEFQVTSLNNQLTTRYIYPNRGVIFDRNGNKLAENVASTNLWLDLDMYYDEEGKLKDSEIRKTGEVIEEIIGKKWRNASLEEIKADTLAQYIFTFLEKGAGDDQLSPQEMLIASNLDNDTTIKVKSHLDELEGVMLEEGSKRKYSGKEAFTHILGYTSIVTAEDLGELDYLGYDDTIARNGFNDSIGRLGVERVYDEYLIGKKGLMAIEVDAYGNESSDIERVVEDVQPGQNLYLTIDKKAQEKMYEVLKKGVAKHKATGGAGIIQDVETGELLVLASYPSYDNNLFVGGISQSNYDKLLNNKRLPLLDRAVGAQFPPGSTFKTIAAAAGIDSKAITTETVYTSRAGYEFSNGAGFQEYQGRSYGPLTVRDALMVSSNIFFCEMIRNWDIDGLVPYYEAFGIGEYTGIDLTGEAPGRLPSPANKSELANTPGITWLEPIWYPEGDSCNTVIGQGIALVTPLQMSNWVSAIANNGTLHTPHLGMKLADYEGNEEELEYETLNEKFISQRAIDVVKEGMRATVNGPRRSIHALTDAKVEVAAKTGTAEFGAVNSEGIYEHTHAWVTGFFPYDNPKYSFVILLEDGGESFYSAELAREFIDWFVESSE